MSRSCVNSDSWGSKFNVAFHGNRVLVWPVDVMSICAVCIVSDPACFNSTCIQFGAGTRVYPDKLSPFRDAREVGFVTIKFFIGCSVLPRAQVDVQFLSQTTNWRASAQSVLGKPEW